MDGNNCFIHISRGLEMWWHEFNLCANCNVWQVLASQWCLLKCWLLTGPRRSSASSSSTVKPFTLQFTHSTNHEHQQATCEQTVSIKYFIRHSKVGTNINTERWLAYLDHTFSQAQRCWPPPEPYRLSMWLNEDWHWISVLEQMACRMERPEWRCAPHSVCVADCCVWKTQSLSLTLE